MSIELIKIPDIGSDSAEVIEILVNVGDDVEADQSLVVLESDKASVEVPCPKAGKVVSIAFSVGDQLSEGADAIELEVSAGDDSETASEEPAVSEPNASETASDVLEIPVVTEVAAVATQESVVCLVPDIGAEEAEVIELSVAVGDEIQEGDSIVVAESDKASLEIPAEFDGVVEALHVAQGDKVSQGNELVTLSKPASTPASSPEPAPEPTSSADDDLPILEDVVEAPVAAEAQTYTVPDVGSDSAEVIEVLVAAGDEITEGDSICVVETDKASVEVPAPVSGKVEALFIAVGDQIGQGKDFVRILSSTSAPIANAPSAPSESTEESSSVQAPDVSQPKASQPKASHSAVSPAGSVAGSKSSNVYAGPAARKQARELGVELAEVKGSGARGRILIDDINQFVKHKMQSGGASLESGGGRGLPEIPAVDWTKFGEIDIEPMSRIHKATAANMVRNWLNVPHVTQFDDADVTELEKYRAYLKSEAASRGIKMTPLAFILKACAVALTENPKMNSSLHQNGEDLVFKKFVHISIAVDTPAGLMVPVIRDVDKKNIWELAADVISMAGKAKDGKLGAKDMQGACFTISSLGAIGGTGFTPIVPAPQVAILGVSKTDTKPVWDGSEFQPRQMMPLSLSYDHRAVNGADAGKFMTSLVAVLEDLDRIWNG